MCKCKKAAEAVKAISSPAKSNVTISVDVTNIVKYVSLAGIAIVGIIFGTKCYAECVKLQKEAHTKEH